VDRAADTEAERIAAAASASAEGDENG